ncbi:MAG: PTS system mannose/fructose/sorbose family transporter subunit IID [Gemmatimonadales bacterium]
MKPRAEALVRLLAVQAAWTYERMSGIGVGHASAPLLRDLYAKSSPEERRAAVARSAEFFNSHPYLAGVAVGAVVRAERDGVPGAAIVRLRTALSGPLGALGDQLIWAGEVPVLIGLALAATPWLGAWTVLLVVVIHNVLRLWLTSWGLDVGLREGLGVGAALQRSWLPRAAARAQSAAAFAVGLAIPIVGWQVLAGASRQIVAGVIGCTILGVMLALGQQTRERVTGLRFGLGLLLLALIIVGGFR